MDASNIYTPQVKRFTIAGKNYIWREPVRKERRLQQADIADIGALFRGVEMKTGEDGKPSPVMSPSMAAISLRVITRIMDFFEAHHGELAKDAPAIWDALDAGTLRDDEIVTAFVAIQEFVLGPLSLRAANQEKNSNGSTNQSAALS